MRKHLNNPQTLSLPPSLPHGHLDQFEIPYQFLSFSKTCLPNAWRHVYTMFTDMFEPCLRNVYTKFLHVYTMFSYMFTVCLKTCLHSVWGHVYIILEDHVWKHVYLLYETCLNNILRNICTMLKEMLTQSCIYHVRRYIYLMFKDIIQSYLKTCFHNF